VFFGAAERNYQQGIVAGHTSIVVSRLQIRRGGDGANRATFREILNHFYSATTIVNAE